MFIYYHGFDTAYSTIRVIAEKTGAMHVYIFANGKLFETTDKIFGTKPGGKIKQAVQSAYRKTPGLEAVGDKIGDVGTFIMDLAF